MNLSVTRKWLLEQLGADAANIAREFRHLNRKLDCIMADLTNLNAAVDQVGTDVQEAIVALDELSAKVGAGDGIDQGDIDAITEKLKSAGSSLDEAVARDNPPADEADPTV